METGRLPGDVYNLSPLEREFCYQAALLHIDANKPK
jgi:hypothetical protein